MAKYQHVIWDWNGTLLNDAWLCHEISNQQLSIRGLPQVERDLFLKRFRVPIRDFLVEIGLVGANEDHVAASHEFHGLYQQRRAELQLHSGASEVLAHIAALGVSQSILSAHPQDMLIDIVRHFKIDKHFTALIGHKDLMVESKVSIGRTWLQSSGKSPAKMVMIGDTEHDFEVAQALGVDCILIPNGMQHRALLEPISQAKLLNSISDLIGHL